MSTINLEQEILRENETAFASEKTTLDEQAKLDAEVEKVLATATATYLDGIMDELGFDYKMDEAQRIRKEREAFAKLPQNRIMSLGAIRNTCIKYGLRFLPTRFYKGALDAGIGPKLEEFRTALGGKLPTVESGELLEGYENPTNAGKTQMYIAAPSESFVLQPMPRDPLLFCRLGANKFYLLHKWGADLKTADLRKGEITERNWNSVFTTSQRSMSDVARDLMGISQLSFTPTFTTTGAGQWIGTTGLSSFTTSAGTITATGNQFFNR